MVHQINEPEYDGTRHTSTRPPGFALAFTSRSTLILILINASLMHLGENCRVIKSVNKFCNENVKDVQTGIKITMSDYAKAVAVDPKS